MFFSMSCYVLESYVRKISSERKISPFENWLNMIKYERN